MNRARFEFPIQSAGEAARFFVRREHTVAGCKNRDRICAACAADGANGLRFADSPRDFTVTACFAA
jgi:hypothetical protein